MVLASQEPDEWLLLSTCIARTSELHPIYASYPGMARRDLENAIRANRTTLRGHRSELSHDTPEVIEGPITARHELDLIHNTLSERRHEWRAGVYSGNVVYHDVEVEWIKIKEYLLALAANRWPTTGKSVEASIHHARARPLTDKGAMEFVKNYIEQEKKAGRTPTSDGAVRAAKEAGFKGNRESLRQAFRQIQIATGIPVRRGRTKKSPS